MLLDRLYEPDFNILHGTKYLAYIRDSISKYWPKTIDERTKWLVITSSYNQGWGYYKNALKTIVAEKKNPTWENIKYYVLNPKIGNRKPWTANVNDYGPGVIGILADKDLKLGLSIGLIAAMGVGGFFFYKTVLGGKMPKLVANPVSKQLLYLKKYLR